MNSTTHSTCSRAIAGHVSLQRELAHDPAAVYAAWSRLEALQRWGHPGAGWWLEFDRFAFQVGQSDLCRFGPEGETTGFVNENRYLAIEPQRRIVYATTLAPAGDGQAPSFAGVVTVEIEALPGGRSRLSFQELGLYFDGADDEAGHRAGWEQMLDQLAIYLDAHRPQQA